MPLSAAVIMRGISSNELQINHCNNDIINNNNWKVITSKRITGFFSWFFRRSQKQSFSAAAAGPVTISYVQTRLEGAGSARKACEEKA